MTELELMFDSLFISMADGRVMAGHDDSEKFMKRVVELEGENQRLRDAIKNHKDAHEGDEMWLIPADRELWAALKEKE